MYRVLLLLILTSLVHAKQPSALIDGSSHYGVWSERFDDEDQNILSLVDVLKRSSTGEKLIALAHKKAQGEGKNLSDLIKAGEVSLTDTTLVRRFYPDDPDSITYKTKSTVFINREHRLKDALLDLSHELTHYIYRENFNPYTLNFSLREFIQSTIEATGGEVHAFVTECQVMRELFTEDFSKNYLCQQIIDSKGNLSLVKASQLFYQVGDLYPKMKELLAKKGIFEDLHFLSHKKAKFISSAYGMPYPLAAYYEYETVLKKVCDNDKKRLAYMRQEKNAQSRSPASVIKLATQIEKKCAIAPSSPTSFL